MGPKKTTIWAKAIGQGYLCTLDTCLVLVFCIALDRRGYPHNIFLVSLFHLAETLLMSTTTYFLWRNKKMSAF